MGIEPATFGILDSPILSQLSYEAKSVRVCGISELSLVLSIPMCSYDHDIFCVCFDVMYSGEYNVSECVSTPSRLIS